METLEFIMISIGLRGWARGMGDSPTQIEVWEMTVI